MSHPAIEDLRRRLEHLERLPTQIRPGVGVRVDRFQNQYTIHTEAEGGVSAAAELPWTFTATTAENQAEEEIPALALSAGSVLWDYAGASGQIAIAPELPFPLDPVSFPAGDYHIGLRVNYDATNPMLPEDEPSWLDAGANPCPAIIQVTAGFTAPAPAITGTDPNSTILEHTISLGLLTIDGSGNLEITNLRAGQIITLWPAAIEGLPTSHPLF